MKIGHSWIPDQLKNTGSLTYLMSQIIGESRLEKRAKLPDSKIRFFSQIFLQKGVSQYHLIPFLLMAMVLMMN